MFGKKIIKYRVILVLLGINIANALPFNKALAVFATCSLPGLSQNLKESTRITVINGDRNQTFPYCSVLYSEEFAKACGESCIAKYSHNPEDHYPKMCITIDPSNGEEMQCPIVTDKDRREYIMGLPRRMQNVAFLNSSRPFSVLLEGLEECAENSPLDFLTLEDLNTHTFNQIIDSFLLQKVADRLSLTGSKYNKISGYSFSKKCYPEFGPDYSIVSGYGFGRECYPYDTYNSDDWVKQLREGFIEPCTSIRLNGIMKITAIAPTTYYNPDCNTQLPAEGVEYISAAEFTQKFNHTFLPICPCFAISSEYRFISDTHIFTYKGKPCCIGYLYINNDDNLDKQCLKVVVAQCGQLTSSATLLYLDITNPLDTKIVSYC